MEANATPQWTLGDHLRKARTHAQISTEVMAAELGVTRNTVTNYEAGSTRPKRAVVKVWADTTGCEEDWLIAAFERELGPSGCMRETADQTMQAA